MDVTVRRRGIAAAAMAVALLMGCEQKSDVGGPFTLTDHTGARVTEADFRGQPMVIYFGFTYCPDVCPLSLQKLAIAMDMLGEDAKALQPILISLDPERDSPEQMALYVESNGFPPNLVGLTGTPEEIDAVAQAYRVFHRKVEEPESAAGYLIEHTSVFYLMDQRGRFVTVFSHSQDPQSIAEELRRFLTARGLAG
ncbi:MAG: SCO family protein [Caulobacterales bacterium]|nr:SCO family protein [Caulobacterales bacterium]